MGDKSCLCQIRITAGARGANLRAHYISRLPASGMPISPHDADITPRCRFAVSRNVACQALRGENAQNRMRNVCAGQKFQFVRNGCGCGLPKNLAVLRAIPSWHWKSEPSAVGALRALLLVSSPVRQQFGTQFGATVLRCYVFAWTALTWPVTRWSSRTRTVIQATNTRLHNGANQIGVASAGVKYLPIS